MITDPIFAQATSRLALARAEVARLEAFLDVYQELNGGSPSPRTRARHTNAPSGAVADSAAAAVEHIKMVGRAVPTRELLDILKLKGIAVGGKDEIATLSARLSRSSLLVNTRGVGWETTDANEEGAVGDLLGSSPTTPGSTPYSADSLPGGGT